MSICLLGSPVTVHLVRSLVPSPGLSLESRDGGVDNRLARSRAGCAAWCGAALAAGVGASRTNARTMNARRDFTVRSTSPCLRDRTKRMCDRPSVRSGPQGHRTYLRRRGIPATMPFELACATRGQTVAAEAYAAGQAHRHRYLPDRRQLRVRHDEVGIQGTARAAIHSRPAPRSGPPPPGHRRPGPGPRPAHPRAQQQRTTTPRPEGLPARGGDPCQHLGRHRPAVLDVLADHIDPAGSNQAPSGSARQALRGSVTARSARCPPPVRAGVTTPPRAVGRRFAPASCR